MTNVLL